MGVMADDPIQAGEPRTRDVTRVYENDAIRVLWDATRCIHTGICLRTLPAVFDVQARPWIDLDGAEAPAIAEAIRACPTGALRYESTGDEEGVEAERGDGATTVEIRPGGPLYVRGPVRLVAPGGRVLTEEEHRVALCRCGASENKPFCDNSHRVIEFRG
jgi:uncharacterized Fe-S cluster protein YjdI